MKLLILCNDRLALPALSQLLQTNAVAGVGMLARSSEVQLIVADLCARHKIPLRLFAKTGFEEALHSWLQQLKPDVVLVKTFPWKIPAACLALPSLGFINFHYAPLPEYRGANPLFWMIKNGVGQTGVTVHQMTEMVDEGPILLHSVLPIQPQATFGMVVSALGFSGMELAGQLLQALKSGTLQSVPQVAGQGNWYPRPQPKDLWVDWTSMNAMALMQLVNACNPWNRGAPAKWNNWTIGLSFVTPVALAAALKEAPGTVLAISEASGLVVACSGQSAIRIDVVFSEEGFLPGFALAHFGLRPGDLLS